MSGLRQRDGGGGGCENGRWGDFEGDNPIWVDGGCFLVQGFFVGYADPSIGWVMSPDIGIDGMLLV